MNNDELASQPGHPASDQAATSPEIPDDSSAEQASALQSRIEELEAQVREQAEQMLRVQADAQNARRRAEREVENAHKFALERFASDLLPVVDSLERGMQSAEASDTAVDALREGMTLTLRMLLDTLRKFNVEQLDPHGEPFNPQYHEAMSMLPNPNVEPNTVMTVLQKGYLLNGRLVRPAMVVVAKAVETDG